MKKADLISDYKVVEQYYDDLKSNPPTPEQIDEDYRVGMFFEYCTHLGLGASDMGGFGDMIDWIKENSPRKYRRRVAGRQFGKNWLYRLANDTLDDFFSGPFPKEVRRDPPQQEVMTITLYRGFDADLDILERSGDDFILSPSKSEQGVIWFSRDKSVADWRGAWLLTYPLEVTRHFERVYYDDDSSYDQIPDSIHQSCSPTENCRFHGNIELPDGWFFSYKVEKHIICSIPLKITRDMLQRV